MCQVTEPSDLIPIGEAARMLAVNPDTLRRWEREGKLKSSRTLGNQRRYSRAEIEQLIQKRETA